MRVEFQELQNYVGPKAKIEICRDWLESIGYPINDKIDKKAVNQDSEIFDFIKENAFNKMDDLLGMVKEKGFKTVRGKDFTYLNLRNFLISKGYANLSELKKELKADTGDHGVSMIVEDLNQ